jgi:hypothetical protein
MSSRVAGTRRTTTTPQDPPLPARLFGMGNPDAQERLAWVRSLCLALPEATERLSHGAPTFFVRDKPAFVMFVDDHHGDGRLALWCAAAPGVQGERVADDPGTFFVPPYVGGRGWLGVRLDRDPDPGDVEDIVEDAYRQVAPKKLLARLDNA